MDLCAYANIFVLSDILLSNDIYFPRLRGLRLMMDEEKINFTIESMDGGERNLRGS